MADEFGGWDWNFSTPDYNFDFGGWDFPAFDWSAFNWPDFNFDFGGFGGFPDESAFNFAMPTLPDLSSFAMPDPLALPTYNDFFMSPMTGNQPDFSAFGIPDQGFQGIGSPATLADMGFGGSAAPSMALPPEFMQGTDPIPNLMGSDAGQGFTPFQGEPFTGMDDMGLAQSPIASGGYGVPGGAPAGGMPSLPTAPLPGLGGSPVAQPGAPGEAPAAGKGGFDWGTLAKLAAAFGPTAIGAAGLGLQAANRPGRNPLEDELIRARIASTGLQDTLAKDRLAFERENAEAMREAQMAMQERMLGSQQELQNAMIASRRPGGQANIQALLQGNPQLAALYNALTKQSTGLASGEDSPEFNAMIEQIAQVDIAELQRQAQQQIAQAQEMAVRQGINPANIIAEIQQRVLQESAKARANARQTLIAQMGPGMNLFNSIGGIFGNLFQTPAAVGT